MENKNQKPVFPYGADERVPVSGATPLSDIPEGFLQGSDALSLDEQAPKVVTVQQPSVAGPAGSMWQLVRRADVLLVLLVITAIAGTSVAFDRLRQQPDKPTVTVSNTSVLERYDTVKLPLGSFAGTGTVSGTASVAINGPILLNDNLLLTPSVQPTGAKPGQIYFDKASNQLAYYNGQGFVFLTAPGPTGVQSLGGATGAISLGSGLSVSGGQLSVVTGASVLSVQGQSGAVTFTAGPGIVINGTSFRNSGVLSVLAGTPNVTIGNDGNGNVSVSVTTGAGTITSGGGTTGTIPVYTASQNIEDSIITQSGLAISVNGDLNVVSGDLTLSNALTVANGGTGASTFTANGLLVGQGASALTTVAAAGGSGLCLLSTAGLPAWGACPMPAGGVDSLNGLTGNLAIANASGVGTTVTIDDASAVAKGIASFGNTNFTVTAGAVDTIQDINTTATPTFAGVNTNTVTPSAALTVGATGQQLTLQGNASSVLTATNAGSTTTLSFVAPTANVTYRLQTTVAGTYDVCTSAGNCLGGGGGAANTALSNLASVAINTSLLPGAATIDLGSAAAPFRDLYVGGTATNNFRFTGTASAPRTYTLPDASGTLAVSASGNIALSLLGDITFTGQLPIANGGTNANTASGARTNLSAAVSGANDDISSLTALTTITPPGALTIGSVGQQLSLQGSTASTFAITSGVNTTTLAFVSPIATATYLLPASSAGTYNICTSATNCASTALSDGSNLAKLNRTGVQEFLSENLFSHDVTIRRNTTTAFQVIQGASIPVFEVDTVSKTVSITGTADITADLATDVALVVHGASSQSVDIMQLQNSLGAVLFNVDETGQVGIGVVNPQHKLDVNGDANVSGIYRIGGTAGLTLDCSGGYVMQDVVTVGGIATSGSCAAAGGSVTLQSAYNNSTDPEIVVDATRGALTVRDAATPIGANLLEVQSNDGVTTYFAVTAGRTNVGPTNGVNTKLLTVSDVLNPTSAAGASGLSVVLQGGGGIYIKDNTNDCEAKFESYNGSGSVGTMSVCPFSLWANNGEQVRIATNGDVYLLKGYVRTDNDINLNLIPAGSGHTNVGDAGTTSRSLNTNDDLFVAGRIEADGIVYADNSINTPTITGITAVTPSAALTVGATGQQLTLQGNASTVLTATNAGSTTTLSFVTPTANVTYRLQTASAGTYDVCTTAGNCTGTGGGVTTVGGTPDRIAKFTSAQGIADSTISDDGTTVATTIDLVVQGGELTVGVANTQTGSISLADGGTAFVGTITQGTLGANRTYTLPNLNGEFCLDTGNCLGGSGGGANTALSNLASVAINTSLLAGATTIDLGSAAAPFRDLYVGGTATNNFRFTGTASAARTITIPNASGTLAVSASGNIALSAAGDITFTGQLPIANGGTNANTAGGARTNLGAAASGINADITATSALNSITPSGALTVGAITQPTTITGNSGTTIVANDSGFTTHLNFAVPTANVIYRLQTAAAGTYDVCTTAGNCSGAAGANTSLSNLSSVAINTSLLAGSATIDLGSAAAPFRDLYVGGTATNNFRFTGTASAARTITIPNASGTLAVSASGNIALSAAGDITFTGQLPVANGGTNANTAGGARTNLGAAANGANADITSMTALTAITPGSALTVGATGQQLTLQGNASTVLTATNAGSTTTFSFVTPTANVTYQLQTAAAGTYDICTTAGNCSGAAGANTALSNLASVAINTSLLPGATTIDLGSAAAPFRDLYVGGTATNNFRFTGTASAARTITIPNASGTLAVSASGNIALSAVGDISFTGQLPIANGGTNAVDAAGARTNLGLVAGGAGDIWVEKAGDTMTGALTLSGNPTLDLHAATKQYVDTATEPAGVTWTSRTSAADNNWLGVAYGNGLFVAVGGSGTTNRVMTSPDGINWTIRTTPNNDWMSVAYGNGLFVAVSQTGTLNRAMTSPDGVNWTVRTTPNNNNYRAVTYGKGLFVAVAYTGTGNRVMTSPDGINWTAQTSAADLTWESVTYGNGLFVAVAGSGTGNRVMTSPDGIAWTSQTSAADSHWQSVTYGNGLFVAVGWGATDRVMTSPNGVNWTIQTTAAANNWNAVAYGNGLFVAVPFSGGTNNNAMTSPDGVNWTIRSNPQNSWGSVVYGNGMFVATAQSGTGDRAMTSGKAISNTAPHNNILQGGISVFGNVGIGTSSATSRLQVQQTMTDTSGFLSMQYNELTAAPGAASSATFIANRSTATTANGLAFNITGTLAGMYNEVTHDGSATLSAAYGLQSNMKLTGSGTISQGVGAVFSAQINSGTLVSGIGALVQNPSGGGTINNFAGIVVDELSSASIGSSTGLLLGTSSIPAGDWGIYNASAYNSYIAASLGVGVIGPLQKMHVGQGNLLIDNTFNLMFRNSSGTQRETLGLDNTNQLRLKNPDGTLWINPDTGTVTSINYNQNADVNIVAGTSTGRLGVGTTGPNYKLDVQGGDINVSGVYRQGGTNVGGTTTCSGGNVLQNIVISGGIITGGTCAVNGAGATTTLQQAYDNSSSPATITTSAVAKNVIVKAGTGFDSAGIFQVQNAAGDKMLNVDSVSGELSVRYLKPLITASSYIAPTTTDVDTTGDVGQYTAAQIATDGFARIAYYDVTNGDLKYARCLDATCTNKNITTVDSTNDVGRYVSMVLGGDDYARIAYYDVTGGNLKFARCTNGDCTSANIQTVESTNDIGLNTSIALGTDGYAHIAHYRTTATAQLRYYHCSNDDCTAGSAMAVDSGAGIAQSISIAVGTDGYARIAYYDGFDTMFATCSSSNCGSVSITNISDGGGDYVSLALDGSNLPYVAYNNAGTLKYVKCSTANCMSTKTYVTVDATVTDMYNSLRLDSNGYVQISYFDDASDNLKIAECPNAACSGPTLTTLDSTNDTGRYTSLALNDNDMYRVSYYYATGGDLRLAVESSTIEGAFGSNIGSSSDYFNQLYVKRVNLQGGLLVNNTGRTETAAVAVTGGGTSYFTASDAAALTNVSLSSTAFLFRNSSNSATSFQVQNAAGTPVFTVDTSNTLVKIGTTGSPTQAGSALLVTSAEVSGALRVGDSTNYAQFDGTTRELTLNGNARHTRAILLAAEYAGAVLDPGTGANNSGVITSGLDLTNRENYYKWTTGQATSQSYDVVVQVLIPSDFSAWSSSTPMTIDINTDDRTIGTVEAEIIDTAGSTDIAFTAITPTADDVWQARNAGTMDGTYTAGGYMTVRIRIYATSAVTNGVKIGNIKMNYLSKW